MLVRAAVATTTVLLILTTNTRAFNNEMPKWVPALDKLRLIDPETESKWKSEKDCLYAQRKKIMRPYPGNCYTKGGSSEKYETQWWNFWKENRGDISYTFDYVLQWQSKSIDEQFPNMFWFNIAYLKQLRIAIPNPEDIASRQTFSKEVQMEARRKAAVLDEIEKSATFNKRRLLELKAKLHSKQKGSRK